MTMIRVPRDAWRGQTLHVIPLSSCVVWAVMLKVFVCLFVCGGVMGALKYVVIGVVVVVVVVAAALVLLLPTLHRAPVQYVGSPSG